MGRSSISTCGQASVEALNPGAGRRYHTMDQPHDGARKMDADYVLLVVQHRCADALSPEDIAFVEMRPLIVATINALAERTDRLEAMTGGHQDDTQSHRDAA